MRNTYADLEELSHAAADDFSALAREAIAARGVFHVALSGGSTPKRLFQRLAANGKDALPWDRIELWWGDERTVPPDDLESNYRMAREALIEPLQLTHVHRIEGERPDHDAAALAYEREVIAALGSPPVFDLALQGLGSDGHTASLFPHSPALNETSRVVVANPVDSPLTNGKTTRITLTAHAINAARHIRFLVAGANKADALRAVLEGPRDPDRYPSQLIAGADVVWLVDRAAAGTLGVSS
jgi:6-phosphogluconolactonase